MGMTVLKIEKFPAKVLRQAAKPVDEVTPEITKLLDDIAETMYAAPGIGLAAPQVSKSVRVIVLDIGIEEADGTYKNNLLQLVNPEITESEGEIDWEEGCLSVPDFTIFMKRAAKIHVTALDKNGNPIEFDAEELFSVAIQHEIDHLNGKLLIDSVTGLKREMYLKGQKKKHLRDKEPTYL
jgi:peptide deformylase